MQEPLVHLSNVGHEQLLCAIATSATAQRAGMAQIEPRWWTEPDGWSKPRVVAAVELGDLGAFRVRRGDGGVFHADLGRGGARRRAVSVDVVRDRQQRSRASERRGGRGPNGRCGTYGAANAAYR